MKREGTEDERRSLGSDLIAVTKYQIAIWVRLGSRRQHKSKCWKPLLKRILGHKKLLYTIIYAFKGVCCTKFMGWHVQGRCCSEGTVRIALARVGKSGLAADRSRQNFAIVNVSQFVRHLNHDKASILVVPMMKAIEE
jgi:hypothetical protein